LLITSNALASAGCGSKKSAGKNTKFQCIQKPEKQSIFGLKPQDWLQIQLLLFFPPSEMIEKL
jgi:hypothetical protein